MRRAWEGAANRQYGRAAHYVPGKRAEHCFLRKDCLMKTRLVSFLLLLPLMAVFLTGHGRTQEQNGDARDKEAVAKNTEAFIEAFHKGDARALAAFWTPDGDYTTETGRRMKGREAIEKGLTAFFAKNKGLKVRIESESLRFVTPDVAVEDGTTFVIHPDGSPPSRARYTIVHVKKDGRWFLSSVRDAPFTPPSNSEHLGELEWIIGDWAAETEQGDAQHLSVSWTDTQNFMVASFAAVIKGVTVGRATHWIGWDPQAKHIRSWIFDAAGGFGDGAWTREGEEWSMKTKSVRQNGKNATATFVLRHVDADTLTVQAKERTEDGKSLPDAPVFKLKRVK
jgi:uncharacterized protein (TIGR02246 family)